MKQKIKRLFALFLSLAMLLPMISLDLGMLVSAEEEAVAETPDLRVGIMSDVHIGFLWDEKIQTIRFKKVLEFYKSMGVDAIIIAGDLQDISGNDTLEEQKAWMEEFAATWFEVFPNNTNDVTGESVEPVFIYGNHDGTLIANKYWPESLGSYTDSFIKEINGYQFVGVNNGKESEAVVDTYINKAASESEDKPFFYIQHCPIFGTVPGSSSGYGTEYAQAGLANIENHSNAVVFSGHTHYTLTDERSIWQANDWMGGQFTVINTATINYSGLAPVGVGADTVNVAVNGNHGDTEQAMYMTVTGSKVAIDRYSFAEEDPMKIGQTWSFDACDESDRPYTYDNRYDTMVAPAFADGAAITVNEVKDNSVTVTVPAASLVTAEGVSDMIHSYVVDATDSVTGMVVASGMIATEHHIDSDTSRFSNAYTVSINGLQPGKEYILKAYALEFFQKRSEPLTLSITTTGTAQLGTQGDVNGDSVVNADDLAVLRAIHEGTADDTQWSDVDGNHVKESADITALENILAGKLPVSEDADVDALGNSTYHKFTNAAGSAWSYDIQAAVTNGGSGVALRAASTAAADWPYGFVYFDEPLDWSQANQLSFDTLFVNESVQERRWMSVTLISGEQMRLSSLVSFNRPEAGWSTKTISLSQFNNVDFSDIRGVRFAYNMYNYEGRYDGTTENGIYIDKLTTSYAVQDRPDSDLLGTASHISGGERRQGAGETAGKGSAESIMSTGNTVSVTLANTYELWFYKTLNLKVKMLGSGNATVQAIDANGDVLGNVVSLTVADGIWCTNAISIDALGIQKTDVVSGFCFAVSGGTVYLDNMSLTERSDDDLLSTSHIDWSLGNNLKGYMQTEETNGSYFAAKVEAAETATTYAWPRIYLTLPQDIDPDTEYISLDAKLDGAKAWIGVHALDANNNQIGSQVYYPALTGWNNYLFRLSNMGVTDANLSQVKKVFISLQFGSTSNAGDCIYVDNVRYVKKDNDLISASSSFAFNGNINSATTFHSRQVAVGTNNSNSAIYTEGVYGAGSWPRVNFRYDTPIDLSQYSHIQVDFKVKNAHTCFGLEIYAADKTTKIFSSSIVAKEAVGQWQTCSFSLRDGLVSGKTMDDLKNVGMITYWNDASSKASDDDPNSPRQLWLDNLVVCDASADIFAETIFTKPKADSGTDFYSEVIDKTADGHTNVLHLYSNATGGAYTGNWPGSFKFTSPGGSLGLADKTYLEYDIKFTGVHYWMYIEFRNSSGTKIGYISYDMDKNSDWQHYRVALSNMVLQSGYTSVEQVLAATKTVGIEFNWTNQANKTDPVTGEVFIDNLRFFNVDDNDLLSTGQQYAFLADHTNKAINWTMQKDVTCGSSEAIMVTKNYAIADKHENPVMQFLYNINKKAINLSGADTLSVDMRVENAKNNVEVALIDSNLNVYTYQGTALGRFDWNPTGQWVTKRFAVSMFADSNGTYIDPSKIAGIQFIFTGTTTTGGTVGSNVNKGKPGVWYIDNVRFILNDQEDVEYDLVGPASYKWWHTGDYYTCDVNSTEVCGENSLRSVAFTAAAGGTGWPYFQFILGQSYDLSKATLVYDVKFVNADSEMSLKLHDSIWNDIAIRKFGVTSEANEQGWHRMEVDLETVFADCDLTDVLLISFGYNFEANTELDRTIYIDNVQIHFDSADEAVDAAVAAVYNTDNYTLTGKVSGSDTLQFNSTKGETEAAQLVITPSENIYAYEISMTNAVSTSGNVIPASSFEVYAEHYIEVTGSKNKGQNGFFRMP